MFAAKRTFQLESPSSLSGLNHHQDMLFVILEVSVGRGFVLLDCPQRGEIRFDEDGSICVTERRKAGRSTPEMVEYASLPKGSIGSSREAREWLLSVLGIEEPEGPDKNEIDLLDLALHHRFKGYDASFISEAKRYISADRAYGSTINMLFCLPREYADQLAFRALFEQSGFPDTPSVYDAAVHRPAVLALATKHRIATLCGNDPDLALVLLSSPRIDAELCSALTEITGELTLLVQACSEEEESAFPMEQLLEADAALLGSCADFCEVYELDIVSIQFFYRLARRDHEFAYILEHPELLALCEEGSAPFDIDYSDQVSELQGLFNGYQFWLPASSDVILEAGEKLESRLMDCDCAAEAAQGYSCAVLVSKGLMTGEQPNGKTQFREVAHGQTASCASDKAVGRPLEMLDRRLVAAIMVEHLYMSAFLMGKKTRCNIAQDEGLGEAIEEWAQKNGMTLSEIVWE